MSPRRLTAAFVTTGTTLFVVGCAGEAVPTTRGRSLASSNSSSASSSNASAASSQGSGGATSDPIDTSNLSSDPKVRELQETIAARQTELQRERDRNGRLRAELSGSKNGGCWSEQRLKKLEIEVNGSHLPTGGAQRGSSAKSNSGNAAQMKIVFSETLNITIENEEQQQLFAPSGRYVSQDFATNLIRDIAMIKVVKGGVAYNSSRVTLPCFMGIGCWSGYDSFETNRYSLGGLTVKINDQVFYSRNNINYTFEGDHRSWEEKALGANPDYLRLMGRQDCPASQ